MVALLGVRLAGAAEPSAATESEPRWSDVIARLRQQLPGDPAVRRELATAYNNYGVQLVAQQQFREAIVQFDEARRLSPDNRQVLDNLVTVHLNMAGAASQARDLAGARAAIDRALALDDRRAMAYALLGEVEYQAQHLKEAKAAWERAMELDPSLPQVASKLEQVSRELPIEGDFDRVSQFSFDIRYAEELQNPTGYNIRDALLRARREVGADFALWPTYKLVVLVYTEEQFRQLRKQTPDWVAGQYDGKIRMPLPGETMDPEAVTRVLFHEYTHALVHDTAGTRCPTWFNEGLAEYEAWKAGRNPWSALRRAVTEQRLFTWGQLNDQFGYGTPAADVQLAYEQSHSIVQYLVERYSFWRIRRILKELDAGKSLDDVLPREFHVKLPRLQQEWQTWLTQQISGG